MSAWFPIVQCWYGNYIKDNLTSLLQRKKEANYTCRDWHQRSVKLTESSKHHSLTITCANFSQKINKLPSLWCCNSVVLKPPDYGDEMSFPKAQKECVVSGWETDKRRDQSDVVGGGEAGWGHSHISSWWKQLTTAGFGHIYSFNLWIIDNIYGVQAIKYIGRFFTMKKLFMKTINCRHYVCPCCGPLALY